VESYELQSPSSFHIAAIEPAELLVWNKRDFDRLLSEMPDLKKYAEQMGAQKVYSNKQRLMTALTGSPEEKYERFKHDLPGLHLKAATPYDCGLFRNFCKDAYPHPAFAIVAIRKIKANVHVFVSRCA
jgi:hypothetical protein